MEFEDEKDLDPNEMSPRDGSALNAENLNQKVNFDDEDGKEEEISDEVKEEKEEGKEGDKEEGESEKESAFDEYFLRCLSLFSYPAFRSMLISFSFILISLTYKQRRYNLTLSLSLQKGDVKRGV